MNYVLESILLSVSQSKYIDEGDLARSARLILDTLVEGLSVSRSGIWLMNEDHDSLICRLLIDVHNNTEDEDMVLTRKSYPKYFAALDEQRTIRVNDAEYNTIISEFKDNYIIPLGIGSRLDTPIRHAGKMIGIVCSESTIRGRVWTDDEASFSGALADLYGRAIASFQRNKLQHALREANARLEQKVAERTKELQKAMQELRSTQDHLVETEKMAALGGLVSGVAHEVNTPLGVAMTSFSHINEEVHRLREDYQNGSLDESSFIRFLEEFDMAYDIAHSNMERAAKLVADFKKTAVDQTSNVVEPVNLKRSIEALLTSLHPLYKSKGIKIVVDIDDAVFLVTYSGAIDQVVTNLVSNSCIHGFPQTNSNNEVSILITKSEQGVVIDYLDNGLGMDEEVRKRVFEPFFTTNRSNGGSGLGMSITYNLVCKKLNGSIKALSAEEGVHFQIFLPEVIHPMPSN